MSADIALRVRELVAAQLELELDAVQAESHWDDDLEVDDPDIIMIVLDLEMEGIFISDDEVPRLQTVGDLIELAQAQ